MTSSRCMTIDFSVYKNRFLRERKLNDGTHEDNTMFTQIEEVNRCDKNFTVTCT
jgi:hypothetical protein